MDALEKIETTLAKTDAAAALSEKLVTYLDVLTQIAFDEARSNEDLAEINKTITALAKVRGQLAPPPKAENNFPALNFTFALAGGQPLPAQMQPLTPLPSVEIVDVEIKAPTPAPVPAPPPPPEARQFVIPPLDIDFDALLGVEAPR